MPEKIVVVTSRDDKQDLESLVPHEVISAAQTNVQKAIPSLAKDATMTQAIENAIKRVRTHHQIILGDSRHMENIPDESVHLVITSPPYWTLKEYPRRDGQLGLIEDYEIFLSELDKVWRHSFRVRAALLLAEDRWMASQERSSSF